MNQYTETELEYFYAQAGYRPGDSVMVWGSKKHQICPQSARVLEVGAGWVKVQVWKDGGPITGGFRTLELPWASVGKDDAPLPPPKGTPKIHLTDKEKLEPLKHNGRICYILARGERPQGRINCHRFMVDVTADTGRVIPRGTIATQYGPNQSSSGSEYVNYILEDTGESVNILV